MPARHYMLLNQLAKQSADSWPAYRVETAAPEADFLRYNAATEALVTEIASATPLGSEVIREPTPHGIAILFRYCHIASLLAAKDGASGDELAFALNQEVSFEPLNELLESPRKVTSRAETELGLTPKMYPVGDYALSKWSYGDEAVSVPDLRLIMLEAQYDAAIQGHEVMNGSCPANKAKIMRPLFSSVIQICTTDTNLFERSLAEASTKRPTSVIM